jgi:hypothetical protein
MKSATTAVQTLIRLSWLVLIVLGALFWAGRSLSLLPVHIVTGVIFVLLIWVLSFFAIRSGAGVGLAALNFFWSLVVLVLGMTQNQLLAETAHWTIQVLHLLVGVAAIGLAESLAAKIKKASAPAR